MTNAVGGITFEVFSDNAWWRVHRFNSTGNTQVTEAGNIQYLVVAGGGGGGNDMGGGGGGGGVLAGNISTDVGTYTITIGAGGAGAPAGSGGLGTNGGNSNFLSFTSIGGGYGASQHNTTSWPASVGGSGGGASGRNQNRALGTAGQGFAGANSAGEWFPGGGGGANANGATNPANGGNGFFSTILGANGVGATGYWFGGGGGGAGFSARAGNGGLGGGGGGAPFVSDGGFGGTGGVTNGNNSTPGTLNSQTNVPGGAGGNNTGGGGGGGSHFNSNNPGGAGGSGIVAFRYQIPNKPTAVTVNTNNASIILNQYLPNPNFIPVSPIPGYGTPPYTYAISSALPSGLSISSSNGAILGQPTVAVSNVPYTVIVTDSLNDSASGNFTLTTSTTYQYAIEVNTASIDIPTYYGLTPNNITPAEIGGNTELRITSSPKTTEFPYQTIPVTSIPVSASVVYGYEAINKNITELDASFNNYIDLDDKLRTIYGNVNANISGFFLSSQEYTTPGTYTWTVPNGVSSISVAGIGGGGGGSQKTSGGTGGGGGQLKYVNNVIVTPGQVYQIVVGNGGVTGSDFGTSGQFTTMSLVSNGNIILSAAGGGGGDALYWVSNTSSITASDTTQTLYTFVAGISGNQSITYSVSNGTLPTGANLNSTTGVLTWTEQGISNTTFPQFTISASAANQIIDSPVTLTIIERLNIVYVSEGGFSNGVARTGSFTVSALTTFIDVWGCGGGGTSTAASTSLEGAGGGGGAASQLNGYRITVSPGETLNYSIGSYGQPTTISRGANIIFQLNGGANATTRGGGGGGAINIYTSHAGSAGGAGGVRYQTGFAGSNIVGCAGGGGGGGYCDNSPLCAGAAGGIGGTSSTPAGSIAAGANGGAGGTGGGSGVNSRGGNVLLAQGGVVGGFLYNGSGGGAGAGIKIDAISNTLYWGGGGGGAGSGAGSLVTPGGPGCLYAYWEI
jgi:hypothetical protein